jgi:DNA-binding transcriptional LysR family regulator
MKVFEWDDLRIFLAILRGRSVRAASKLLNVSHSTVSRRLQAMEEQLGIKLFIRQPEGFVLTEVGEAMVERAERVESEILSLEREVFGRDALLSGPVRISAPPLLAQHLLMLILARFSELYPQIEIEIDATFDVADLRRRNADIAIRFQVQPEETLVAHRLPDFANAIYANPEYINTHRLTGADPDGRWIALGGKEVLAHWRQETPYAGCKVQHIVSDMLAQLNAVKAGLGFAYLMCFLADSEPGLVRLPDAGPEQTIPAWALTHPDMIATERVRVCVRFLVDAIFEREHMIRGLGHVR